MQGGNGEGVSRSGEGGEAGADACYGCGGVLGAGQGVEAGGRNYHSACFKCRECRHSIKGSKAALVKHH